MQGNNIPGKYQPLGQISPEEKIYFNKTQFVGLENKVNNLYIILRYCGKSFGT